MATLSPSPSLAETIRGVGASGSFGEPGASGGDGESIDRSVGPGDSNNEAFLRGGSGGRGGAGIEPAGDGGDGGRGGDLRVTVTTVTEADSGFARVDATGGNGGVGGQAASGDTSVGGDGGNGGDAHGSGIANSSENSGTVTLNIRGGSGSTGYGAGSSGGVPGETSAEASVDAARGGSISLNLVGGTGGAGIDGADARRGADAIVDSNVNSELSIVVGDGANSSHNESIDATGGIGGLARGDGETIGGNAGDGGDARVVRQLSEISAHNSRITLDAEGGRGGNSEGASSAGQGGNAYAEGALDFDGRADGAGSLSPRIDVGARGGRGGDGRRAGDHGSAGGTAEAHAEIDTTDSGADGTANALAFGGTGGSSTGESSTGRAGGTATATAHAIADANSAANALVQVSGGGGGTGTQGADAGNGADVILENAATGSGGHVNLRQIASGGSGGDASAFTGFPIGDGGRGGDSTSNLTATNLEGSLSLESDSAAGGGGQGGGAGGTARGSGVGTARDDVSIRVTVRGGTSGQLLGTNAVGADGGEALLGPVEGTSTEGGDVDVSAFVSGGLGGVGAAGSGDGASVELENAIDGNSEGAISLRQSATAGGVLRNISSTLLGGGARGGDALSAIETSKSASSLSIEVDSRAGDSIGLDSEGRGISGGNATSRIDASNDAGELILSYEAEAGDGSTPDNFAPIDGIGGDAVSIIRGRTAGDGNDLSIRTSSFRSGSTGGLGGGRGYTEVEGIAEGDSEVDVWAEAQGGASGNDSPQAGVGEAHARGVNAGPSNVHVVAVARGGNGVTEDAATDRGAEGIVSAWGESTGGGDVEVEATSWAGGANAGRGADSLVTNAVGGRTTGSLRLIQNALGGRGGELGAGDARSDLSWVDDDGGALAVEVNATGGGGRTVGNATASASGVGQDGVDVSAAAMGGEGTTFGADGGDATLGRVYGESTNGGDVRVVGSATGGNGDDSSSFGISPFGAGGDATIVNAVGGKTTGSLELVQSATGGEAGNAPGGAEGLAGGAATSSLSGEFDAGFLDVRLEAAGGAGSGSTSGALLAGEGGRARLEGTIENQSGGIRLNASSEGGNGGQNRSGFPGGQAGAASSDLTVISSGDQAPVDLRTFVIAGNSPAATGRDPSPSGQSADAHSRIFGEARGDSVVEVADFAQAGRGRRGGTARSEAQGRNAGSSSVFVSSVARAGRSDVPASGLGDAFSTAFGSSPAGEVTVQSNSRIDTASIARAPLLLDSNAVAHARSAGTGGDVQVDAMAFHVTGRASEFGFSVVSNARAGMASDLSSEVVAGRNDVRAAFSSASSAAVFVTGIHDREGEWMRSGMNLRPNIEDLDIELATELDISIGNRPERLEGLFLSFLDVRFGDDFSELSFRIAYGNVMVVDETFNDRASISAFFSQVLNLGMLDPGSPFPDEDNLEILLEAKGASSDSSFGVAFAIGTIPIPEPGTALLLGFGLVVMGWRRH